MGKLIRKILGNFTSAIGDILFSNWNGQTIIKAKSEGSKSAPTPAQLFVREKFKAMNGLANAFTQVIPFGLDGKAEGITSQYVGSVTVQEGDCGFDSSLSFTIRRVYTKVTPARACTELVECVGKGSPC